MPTNPNIAVSATDSATPVLNRVRKGVEDLVGSFSKFGQLAGATGPLLAVTAAISALGLAVKNAIGVVSWIDSLVEASSALGITADQLASYDQIAKEAGVSTEQLSSAFNTLSKKVTDAFRGNKEAASLFQTLGVAIKDSQGNMRGFDEILLDVAKALDSFKGGPAKVALEMELFNRAGGKLDQTLTEIAKGIKRNTGLNDDMIEQAQRLTTNMDLLSAAWDRFSTTLAGPVISAIVGVAKALGLLEKTPVEQLDNLNQRIIKLQEYLAGFEKGQAIKTPLGQKRFEQLRTELYDLERQATETAAAIQRAGMEDKPNAPTLPGKEDKVKKKKDETEALLKLERKQLLEGIDAQIEEYERGLKVQEKYYDAKNKADEKYYEDLRKVSEKSAKEEAELEIKALEEVERARAKRVKDVEERIDSLTQLTESFFLKLTDFKGADVFKTLGKDLYNLAYRMLILEPILLRIRTALKGMTDDVQEGTTGTGFIGIFMKLLGLKGTGSGPQALGGPAFGEQPLALGGPLQQGATLVGESGPELLLSSGKGGNVIPNHRLGAMGAGGVTVVQNNSIDSRTDIGTIAAMLEMNRQSTLRAVREQIARRNPNLRV